ncbi:uncharacterized protein LOC130537642 isoform X2 [Takifugu flavidus]|uniref:uncharacterized protein LOC130537642 isoform X2 n=1 Tax=Takifugu flavidus TaxID=433684 RepID=UPI00254485DC|nr:uncharacterized protein LOC130537642 isoform X2 [Takifugu flavidus]
MLRVAVIGAGAAGLCVARHILSRLNVFAPPVVFELSENIGGTWCYDERVGTCDIGRLIHSSMYRDLRTNLPKEVMMFPDFPFDSQLSSFLPHQEVQNYLRQYCEEHHIRPHIRFNTAVEKVTPVVTTTEGDKVRTTWEVTSSDSSGGQRTETFDSVFVCSGHYSDPHIPNIPGIKNFKGKVLHSHDYKYAEPFSGQSVVVLGAKASGLDISIELANVGAQVILSHGNARLTFPLPSGIQQSAVVKAVDEDGNICFQVIVVSLQVHTELDQNLSGRLCGFSRCADVLHRLQLQISFFGRVSAWPGHPGPSGVSHVPLHDAAGLPLPLLHWHLQDHLPVSSLQLSGPVCISCAGWPCHFTACIPDER